MASEDVLLSSKSAFPGLTWECSKGGVKGLTTGGAVEDWEITLKVYDGLWKISFVQIKIARHCLIYLSAATHNEAIAGLKRSLRELSEDLGAIAE